MKAQLILCIALILLPHFTSSQTAQIEKLIEAVKEKNGREKLEAFSELSFQYFRVDPKKGVHYGNLALMYADSLDLPSLKSKAYNSLGANYISLSNHDSAQQSFHQAMHFATIYRDTFELATAYNRLGVVYERKGVFDSALIVFGEALGLFEKLGNIERVGVLNENIGMIYLHRGEVKSALINLLLAEEAFENGGLRNKLPSVYLKIGRVHSETGDIEMAQKWYTKGKSIALEINDYHTAAVAINAIGMLYSKQGRYENARENYLKAVELSEKIQDRNLLQAFYNNLGNVYRNMGKHNEALDYHRRSLELIETLKNPILLAEQYVNIAHVYTDLKDFKRAADFFEKALPIFTSSQSRSKMLNTYQGLITATNGLKAFDKSVAYYEKYLVVKDSLNRFELNKSLDSLKVMFNTEHTLSENTLLAQKNELNEKTITLQRTILLSGLIVAALLLVFVINVVRSRRKVKKTNHMLALKNEEILTKAQELEDKNKKLNEYSQYKDSINSFLVHDLKNPLNAILHPDNDLSVKQQIEKARQSGLLMLNIIVNLLDIGKNERKMLKPVLSDESLTGIIRQAYSETDFLAKQKSIRLVIKFHDDFVVNVDRGLVNRLFVNMFINAIKFSGTAGSIQVAAELVDSSFVRIEVKDNGEGIAAEHIPHIFELYTQGDARKAGLSVSTGIGLSFCKMTVENHGGKIGVQSEVGKGTSFWFTIPLSHSEYALNNLKESFDFQPESHEPIIKLTLQDRNFLLPYCKQLESISVYQITDVKAIVKPIECVSENISMWKLLVLRALSECNETNYKNLTTIHHDEPL